MTFQYNNCTFGLTKDLPNIIPQGISTLMEIRENFHESKIYGDGIFMDKISQEYIMPNGDVLFIFSKYRIFMLHLNPINYREIIKLTESHYLQNTSFLFFNKHNILDIPNAIILTYSSQDNIFLKGF